MSVLGTIYGDDKVEAALSRLPSLLKEALSRAMRVQWLDLQRYIITSKLSGQVLRRRTGVLASSINVGGDQTASEFLEDDQQIVGRVGTKVWYGAVHEYGGSFRVKPHERTITQAFGREITPRTIQVSGYDVHFPERSFLRSGLSDRSSQIRDAIAASVRSNLQGIM